ncbi:hypothetical protein WJX79_003687 [Trebouxia sp. C0005]
MHCGTGCASGRASVLRGSQSWQRPRYPSGFSIAAAAGLCYFQTTWNISIHIHRPMHPWHGLACTSLVTRSHPLIGHVGVQVGIPLQVVDEPEAARIAVVQATALHPAHFGWPPRTSISRYQQARAYPVA